MSYPFLYLFLTMKEDSPVTKLSSTIQDPSISKISPENVSPFYIVTKSPYTKSILGILL